jgi:ribonuclease-3
LKTSVEWLRDVLGYECRDLQLLESALTHRSAGGAHNERLEFLGDAVLNCVIAKLVFSEFAVADEGDLSRFRASLVSGESLAVVAAELGVGERLHLGSGELKSGGFRRKSILADALEAVLGAIYLDGGYDAAAATIERLFIPRLASLPTATELKDPKTRLQEALQARAMPVPLYQVESVIGKSHEQLFRVSCIVDALSLATIGEGASRRAAEQAAAKQLLDEMAASRAAS